MLSIEPSFHLSNELTQMIGNDFGLKVGMTICVRVSGLCDVQACV
jgi:hypothetical protein